MTDNMDRLRDAANAVAYDSMRNEGMTLRDWFAGQALAGLATKTPTIRNPVDKYRYSAVAVGAYYYADAMIAEREREKKP